MRERSLFALRAVLLALLALAVFGAVSLAAPDETAAKLFKARCATCHGVDGRGDTTAGRAAGVKDWTDGKTLKALSDAQIEQTIRTGVKAPDGKDRMPPFPKLTDDQIKALREHVRSLAH